MKLIETSIQIALRALSPPLSRPADARRDTYRSVHLHWDRHAVPVRKEGVALRSAPPVRSGDAPTI